MDKLVFTRFEPHGYTGEKDIKIAHSIIDYIFKWMGITFLGRDYNSGNGQKIVSNIEVELSKETDRSEKLNDIFENADTALCNICGGVTVRAGACHTCTNCGTSSGCG